MQDESLRQVCLRIICDPPGPGLRIIKRTVHLWLAGPLSPAPDQYGFDGYCFSSAEQREAVQIQFNLELVEGEYEIFPMFREAEVPNAIIDQRTQIDY